LKYLILTGLIFLAGCREEEAVWDQLTNEERDYIREQSRLRCESDAAKNFEDLVASSNSKLLDYERGDYWKVTVSGSSMARNLRVWKIDGNNVYFLYYDPSIGSNFFIKISADINAEMFEDLRKKKCNTTSGYTITQSSSSVTIKKKDVSSIEDSTRYKTDYTYTGSNSTPLFFAYFSVAENKKKLNNSGSVVSTENLINKIEYLGKNTDVLEASFTSYYPRRFCIIKYTGNAGTIGTDKSYHGPVYPFSANLSCTADGADSSNANAGGGDPAMSFTSSELILSP
jgi:hypothetical protein